MAQIVSNNGPSFGVHFPFCTLEHCNVEDSRRVMRSLLLAALVTLTASFASIPYKRLEGADLILAETTRAVPEGLVLIRDTYQFENAEHPIAGFTPDSPGPHKLIVVPSSYDTTAYETEFGAHDWAFALRRRAMEKAVATQGHGMVIVDTPGFKD